VPGLHRVAPAPGGLRERRDRLRARRARRRVPLFGGGRRPPRRPAPPNSRRKIRPRHRPAAGGAGRRCGGEGRRSGSGGGGADHEQAGRVWGGRAFPGVHRLESASALSFVSACRLRAFQSSIRSPRRQLGGPKGPTPLRSGEALARVPSCGGAARRWRRAARRGRVPPVAPPRTSGAERNGPARAPAARGREGCAQATCPSRGQCKGKELGGAGVLARRAANRAE
jgi:hypothetical protein